MKLLRGIKQLPELHSGSVVTIGNFDGVHLGHQALLSFLKIKAKALGLPLVVVLFEPQPAEYFKSNEAPARLSSLREKLLLLRACKVDYVLCLTFNELLANTSASDFARDYLFGALHCQYLSIGEDFRFGYQRKGHLAMLQELAKDYSCDVNAFGDFLKQGERVSSTQIRTALARSEFDRVKVLLGRPYSMCGRVMRGDGRGRQWGIPTANLKLNRKALPLKGVFCVEVEMRGQTFKGVANLGSRPTVDGRKNILEVHLLDFDGSLYGEVLQVFFLHKLRDEVKFESVDELLKQIHQDIDAAGNYFFKKSKY